MKCSLIRESLDAYLDGQLGAATRLLLRLHLLRCTACRGELQALRQLSGRLTGLPAPATSPTVRAAVLAASHEAVPAWQLSRRRLVASLATSAVVLAAAGGFLFTRPTSAQAAFNRVIAASGEVKSCHFELVLQSQDGSHETRRKTWYSDGKWRWEEWKDGELESAQVFADRKRGTYLPRENRVLLSAADQPFGTKFTGFAVADMLQVTGDARVKVSQVNNNGRHLNRFEITDETLPQRTVVFADPETDLPTSYQVYHKYDGRWALTGESAKIEYNAPLEPELFVLACPADAEVIDRQRVKEEWWQRVNEGMLRVSVHGREAVLHDFQVTSEGDIFAFWSGPGMEFSTLPDAKLTDSLGTIYVRDEEGHGYFQAFDNPCSWFVANTPTRQRPSWYRLSVAGAEEFVFLVRNPIMSGGPDPIYPAFEHKKGAAAFLYLNGEELRSVREQIREQHR